MIKITDKKNCTGCYACLNTCPQSCIIMKDDFEGFWYPVVDYNKCINCGLCENVCPVMHKTQENNEPRAYACINKNEIVRLKSSSGGIFTLVAEHVINNDGVVFGASFHKDFTVVHSYVETKEDLEKFRGSKYVQSKIGDAYKQAEQFLRDGRQVLFSGTPCQIAGLKSFLQREYDNLLCIDIVCHGVPSPKVWERYISYHENRIGASVKRIAFRRKDKGWKRFSVSLLFNNDTEYLETFDKDLFMQAFLKNICLRPSCYACNFKTLYRQSDITLADFWGIENLLPEMDDDKGTSLVFINSARGESVFKRIKDKILYKEVDINKAVEYNLSAIKSVEKNPKRDKFFKELDRVPFDELVKKYCSDRILVRVKRNLKAAVRSVLKKLKLLNMVENMAKMIRMK